MIKNQEYKNAALAALSGHWTAAMIVTIVFLLITMAIVVPSTLLQPDSATLLENMDPEHPFSIYGDMLPFMFGSSLLSLFVLLPLSIGFYYAFLLLFRRGDDKLTSNMFNEALRPKYGRNVLAMFLVELLEGIGLIFFFVPGIILALCYSQVPFVLKDHPELSAVQAMKKSREMMRGHKFDYFWLSLSFLGWILLACLTLGLALIWLLPYMVQTLAVFYEDVKNGTAGLPGEPVAAE